MRNKGERDPHDKHKKAGGDKAEQELKTETEACTEAVEAEEAAEEVKSEADQIREELLQQIEKVKELEDRELRLAAEFDNFRKRSRKEKEQTYLDAKTDVIKALLPIFDNIDRAIESGISASNEESRQMAEGMELVRKQAAETLASIGVEEIICENQPFDPELHDAIQHIEDEALEDNTVAKVILKGYKVGDTVIRHSMVIVAN